MVATWLICQFVEMFINWTGTGNDLETDFLHLKVVFGQGGILRRGDGMSFRKDTLEALLLTKESL
ncbi:MAG: hypothetical protein A2X84_06170 [Desulfuromonadaceae bacterium GWC2_58_13]|nr:MAG: hypothetical protein A2X84_06170 [Desulfuromonadaceae bacterium GWC2_58_13]